MATYSPSPNVPEPGAVRPSYDDEQINLRPFLDALLRWWREILLITAIAALLGSLFAIIYGMRTPPLYQASAQVAIARIVSNVNLDANYQTEMFGADGLPVDVKARRASLLGLVTNNTIANKVLEELRPMLGARSATGVLRMISAGFVGDDPGDLIFIQATSPTPEIAAAVANAWAKHYVENVNELYGELPADMAEVVETELGKAQTQLDEAQKTYEDFLGQNDMPTLSRQIQEKEALIGTLQSTREVGLQSLISQTMGYRQDAILAYVTAANKNRLLALDSEQTANSQLIQNLIQTISENRLLALSTDQEARVELFTQATDLELENRLKALQQEQNTKSAIFSAYSDADLRAKLTVFNEQIDSKVGTLVETYANKTRVDQLLDEAKDLQTQIEQAGEAGANSNSLPLLLLKIEAYAATATNNMTGAQLTIDLTNVNALETAIENQASDVAVLVDTLTQRSGELATRIEEQSQTLVNNEGYQLLDSKRPEDDALYAAIQEQYLSLFQIDGLAESVDSVAGASSLSQAIAAKYDELFGIGSIASASLTISSTMSIYEALQAQYPSLFNSDSLAMLEAALTSGAVTGLADQQKILDLMQPPDELKVYFDATAEDSTPFQNLEAELRSLHSALEQKQATLDRVLNNRNVAQEAYSTLQKKLLELTLQRTAANREVRLASAAYPPDSPVAGLNMAMITIVAGALGFILAVGLALVGTYVGAQPFLSKWRQPPLAPIDSVSQPR